jgi:pyridinium-3,5-bisthiocarboxylic acid mononucleotide nickel chelatase
VSPNPPPTSGRPAPSEVVELAVNLDDLTGQVLGDAQVRLLEAGALDVWTVPIGMKKQRPGVMLCVLAEAPHRDALARLMLELTGSFGVRFRAWQRLVLDRRHEPVQTRLGPVRLKVGTLAPDDGGRGEELVVVQPEFEDVRALARSAGVSLRTALQAAHAAADTWRAARAGGKGAGP